jgi:hypothetical protein
MTGRTLRHRLLAGKLLIAVGIGFLASWIYYFVALVRPIDYWDFSPLPVAAAAILIGIRIARHGERQLTQAPILFSK